MLAYELHIGVKDYCFGRDDQLIGVSVMQLKDIMDQVQLVPAPSTHIGPGRLLKPITANFGILNILPKYA